MKTPGSAAIELPKFTAPAFTGTSLALGAAVTGVGFLSTSDVPQANVPFSIGQPIKQGQLAMTDGLALQVAGKTILVQASMMTSWPDGSASHAIISGVLPALPARAIVEGVLVRAAPVAAARRATPTFDARMTLSIAGAVYVADANTTPPAFESAAGAVSTEYIIRTPFVSAAGAHPVLTAGFHIRYFHDLKTYSVRGIVENAKAYTAVEDVTYDATLAVGGATRFTKSALVHKVSTRWSRLAWAGAAPALHICHDRSYVLATKLVPPYDPRYLPSEALLTEYAQALSNGNFGPMGFGLFVPGFGTTGGRPDIGLAPAYYAAAVLSMDKRAKDLMLASADIAGSFRIYRRDDSDGPNAGEPMDLLHFPYATLLGRQDDTWNPETGQKEALPTPAPNSPPTSDPDTAHQAAFSYLPYLLTGDYIYLEDLHFWCNFCLYVDNPGYRGNVNGLVKPDQVRGQAWSMRTIGEAAAITPDSHFAKARFNHWLDCNLDWYNAEYTDNPAANKLGVITNGYVFGYNGYTGLAPWQDDFFTAAIGHLSDLGFSKATKLLKWKAKFVVDRMIASGHSYTDAAIYSLKVRETENSPLYEDIDTCYRKTLDPDLVALPLYSAERLAWMNAHRGLPSNEYQATEIVGFSTTNIGYPSNMQPALAYAVKAGIPGAAEAWALFDKRAAKPDYTTGPQFSIVPPADAVNVPVTPPAPAPVPAPAPAPAPLPTPAPVKLGRITTPSNVKLKAAKSLTVTVFDPDTLAAVKTFEGVKPSTKGVLALADVALVSGEQYAARAASGGLVLDVIFPLTAV